LAGTLHRAEAGGKVGQWGSGGDISERAVAKRVRVGVGTGPGWARAIGLSPLTSVGLPSR
jgi:transposase